MSKLAGLRIAVSKSDSLGATRAISSIAYKRKPLEEGHPGLRAEKYDYRKGWECPHGGNNYLAAVCHSFAPRKV